jgi:hypothetical protein
VNPDTLARERFHRFGRAEDLFPALPACHCGSRRCAIISVRFYELEASS